MLFLKASRFCRNLLEKKKILMQREAAFKLWCAAGSQWGEKPVSKCGHPSNLIKIISTTQGTAGLCWICCVSQGLLPKTFLCFAAQSTDKGGDWELWSGFNHHFFPFYIINQRTTPKIKTWILFAVYLCLYIN